MTINGDMPVGPTSSGGEPKRNDSTQNGSSKRRSIKRRLRFGGTMVAILIVVLALLKQDSQYIHAIPEFSTTAAATAINWTYSFALLLSDVKESGGNGQRPTTDVKLRGVNDQGSTEEEREHPTNRSYKQTLTIAVDQAGSCPDGCVFAHRILPPWVPYHYITFNAYDLTELKAASRSIHSNNYLLVTRGKEDSTGRSRDIGTLADWSVSYRKKTGFTVGLFLMADELDQFRVEQHFNKFDYVLRHYYFQNKKYYLRALGNQTCGDSPPPLPTNNSPNEPRWGVHWSFLPPHKPDWNLLRPASSIPPLSSRPHNCSFIGRSTPAREKMKGDLARALPLGLCDVQFSSGFSQGHSKFLYVNQDLAQTKIGLNPTGNNVECHRLPEMLIVGTVPAMLDAEYLHAPFRRVPGIVGTDWDDVGKNIMRFLLNNATNELDEMSRDGARFYEELQFCMVGDMDLLLRGCFQDAQESRKTMGLYKT